MSSRFQNRVRMCGSSLESVDRNFDKLFQVVVSVSLASPARTWEENGIHRIMRRWTEKEEVGRG